MPPTASPMDSKFHALGRRSTADICPTFKPPSATICDTSTGTSTSPSSLGSMNYSPKHSRKPSSLSNSRNINIQRLSLAASPSATSSTTSPSRRGKPLALYIPSVGSPSGSIHHTVATPTKSSSTIGLNNFSPNDLHHTLASQHGPASFDGSFSRRAASLRSPFALKKAASSELFEPISDPISDVDFIHHHPVHTSGFHSLSEKSPASFQEVRHFSTASNVSDHSISSGDSLDNYTLAVPEELQESSNVYAYPKGPANVLNSIIYLYSDPDASDSVVDVNDFDLVINVAKECKDLSPRFDLHNGHKQYLRVPWSHTSAISNELPEITKTIAKMDKPGKKILIHCQCGVSRSACVVVAYFMVKFHISVNEAYELLKSGTENTSDKCIRRICEDGNKIEACKRICPNMSLIFELMDFGERLKLPKSIIS